MNTLSESSLRRRAAKRGPLGSVEPDGLRLSKVSERSRWYDQYGPYMLVDGSSFVVCYGMDADAVAAELA